MSFIYIEKKKKMHVLDSSPKKKKKQLCQLCRTVLTSLMTETVVDKLFPVLYFFSPYSSAGIPYFLGQPSGPLRGGGGVTHTNTQRSVCPPALTQRVCLTVSVCGGFIFETGKGQKNHKDRRAFLPPPSTTTAPRGRTQCCTHSFTIQSKSLGTFT